MASERYSRRLGQQLGQPVLEVRPQKGLRPGPVEPDGLVRRYPFGEKLDGEFLPSMGAVLAGQHAAKRKPFLIDFGIRAASIPRVSYIDVLRGDDATLAKLRDKKVVIGGTALELGDRFSIPNGGVVSGPLLQALAAESILQNRTLSWTSDIVTLVGLCIISLVMMLSRGWAEVLLYEMGRGIAPEKSVGVPVRGAVVTVVP